MIPPLNSSTKFHQCPYSFSKFFSFFVAVVDPWVGFQPSLMSTFCPSRSLSGPGLKDYRVVDCCLPWGRRQCTGLWCWKYTIEYINTDTIQLFKSKRQATVTDVGMRTAGRPMLKETPSSPLVVIYPLSPSVALYTDTVALQPLLFPVCPANDQLWGSEAGSYPHPLPLACV